MLSASSWFARDQGDAACGVGANREGPALADEIFAHGAQSPLVQLDRVAGYRHIGIGADGNALPL